MINIYNQEIKFKQFLKKNKKNIFIINKQMNMNFMKENISMIYIVISLIVIGILLGLYLDCKKKESFCTCNQKMTYKTCSDPKVLTDLYNRGLLTENTNLAARQNGEWNNNIMPEDNFDRQMGYDQTHFQPL